MSDIDDRPTVLVVDDFRTNVEYLRDFLETEYRVLAAYNGEDALKVALEGHPDVLLLDVMMPGMDGYETCRRFKEDPRLKNIPIIFVTALGDEKDEASAFEAGGSDFLTKPVKRIVVMKRIQTQLASLDQTRRLNAEVQKQTWEIKDTQMKLIQVLGKASEYRDNETGNHIMRMSHFSRSIALAYGLDGTEAELYLSATPMHDVGKIGIRDSILLKPGRLDEEEMREMRKHCEIGERILEIAGNSPLARLASVCAKTHHERWDGSGYPQGLAGEAIPLVGRIASVADVFDALTSKRPYKEAWPIAKAAGEIQNNSGTQFDPAVVGAFHEALEEILEIRESYLEA